MSCSDRAGGGVQSSTPRGEPAAGPRAGHAPTQPARTVFGRSFFHFFNSQAFTGVRRRAHACTRVRRHAQACTRVHTRPRRVHACVHRRAHACTDIRRRSQAFTGALRRMGFAPTTAPSASEARRGAASTSTGGAGNDSDASDGWRSCSDCWLEVQGFRGSVMDVRRL